MCSYCPPHCITAPRRHGWFQGNYHGGMPPSDHYATLGLTPRATQEQIKNAYRQLARKLHPDINKAPDATSRFSAIQHAYEVLADPMQRAEYDTKRDYDASGHGMPESVGRGQAHYSWSNIADAKSSVADTLSDFDDIYETFFAHRQPPRGR